MVCMAVSGCVARVRLSASACCPVTDLLFVTAADSVVEQPAVASEDAGASPDASADRATFMA